MKRTRFWALVKKEFFSYVNSPLAYVVIVPFLLISMFMYFRSALVLGDANLRPFIELLPWFLVVIGPALAMKAFGDEYKKETIELLYAHPLSEWTIAGAKFLGILLFFGLMLLSTISLPISIIVFARPDVGLMVAQYLGAFLIGGVFLATGLAASAFVVNAVGSFLLGAAINFGLMLAGLQFVLMSAPSYISRILIELGVSSHLNTISRGVVDLRDVIYFATIIAISLAAAVMRLSERKIAESAAEKRKLWTIMGLIIGVGVVGNVLMAEYPIRLDLTANQRYSLSAGTKQLLRELPDRVSITLYTSPNLPGPLQITLQEAGDRLKDFARYGDKLAIETVLVGMDLESRQEAVQKGVREVQFNQMTAGSYQIQTGFLGLHVRYGEKTETIDFINDAADLEYQLSRMISSLTREEMPRIGFIENTERANNVLTNFLYEQYEVVMITNEEDGVTTDNLAGILVVDDGSGEHATTSAQLAQYLMNGGNVLALIDGVSVIQQPFLMANASQSKMTQAFAGHGVRVNTDLVFDLQLNEPIQIGQGNIMSIVDYPFWVRALINQEVVPWAGAASNVLLGWPSSVVIQETGEGTKALPLLSSSANAGTQESGYMVSLEQLASLPETDQQPKVMGALIEDGNQRIVVVGDSRMVADDFLENTLENQAFIANMIDWVAADPILAAIPKRTGERTVFVFSSASQIPLVQYGNMFIPAILVAGLGGWWLRRRKLMSKRSYNAA